ncbi:HU family DNA-binding protein [Hydrocarboniphaga sp.]|uniref:HU family DNA-binding protein n=1 Tax=Hydrocarboniphaga sp. TaxID=2033016 RepID=UPI003D106D0A
MKLDEIVTQVAASSGIKAGELKKAIDSVFATIKTTVETGDKVSIPGLGSFVLKNREAGEKVNAKSGEKQIVEAASFLTFKPAKTGAGKKDKTAKAERAEKKDKKDKKKVEA